MLTRPERRAWRIVAFGILMKLIAFAALVIAGVFLELQLLIFALSLDGAGRLACLCAPIQNRKAIGLSVTNQLIAFVLLGVACVRPGNAVFQILELIASAIFQGFSAIHFSRFLIQVAQALTRSDLEERARHLLLRVNIGTATGSTVVLYLIFASPLLLVGLLVSSISIGSLMLFIVIAFLPVVVALLIRVAPMVYNYVVTLNAFRLGVAEMATRE